MTRTTLFRGPSAVLAGVLAASFVLAACGSDGDSSAAPAAPSSSAVAPSAPAPSPSTASPKPASKPSPVSVPASLDFAATTVGGDSFTGASVAGKPVVLWFWAPWCAVCRSQAPQVQQLVAEHGDDLAVIGIGSLDSGSAISGFAEDVSGPLHLSDPDGDLWKRFRISEQSSFVVLDAAGSEVLRTGYNDDDALDDAIEGLVG